MAAWRISTVSRISRLWPILTIGLTMLNLGTIILLVLPIAARIRGDGRYRIDLDVYRLGSHVWLTGGDLYGTLPPLQTGGRLPFTYPPFAAIILSPFTLLPFWLASVLITILTAMLVIAVFAFVLPSLRISPTSRARWLLLGMALPGALLFEPILSNVFFGQINVLLMALVAVDCLGATPRRSRGVLVGIAAAIKLTPAAFLLFLLLKYGRRAVLTTAVSFVLSTALGFALAWHDSVRYWTAVVFNTSRIGDAAYVTNQSIMAVLARFGVQSPMRGMLWLVLVAIVLVLATMGIRRTLADRHILIALCLNAVAELLCSPISWTHHWVWMPLLVLGLTIIGWRSKNILPITLSGAGLLLFSLCPQRWLPQGDERELHWTIWQQIPGNCYVYFGVALLGIAALRPLCPPRLGLDTVNPMRCTSSLAQFGGWVVEFRVDRNAGLPAYRQLVRQIQEALRLGWLRPGDRLPTVREVVTTCGINPNTVLKAYRELELIGLLEVRQGSGTFVKSSLGSATSEALDDLREQLTIWVRDARKADLEDEDIQALLNAVLADEAGHKRNRENKR